MRSRQGALDLEAFRRLDVLQIDAAEGRLERGDDFDQLLRIERVDLDVEHVDAGEFLEEDGLAFHHRLRRQRADVAEAEHRGAVREDRHQVLADRHFVRLGGVGVDGHAGRGRRRANRRGPDRAGWRGLLGRLDLELTRTGEAMIVERVGGELVR